MEWLACTADEWLGHESLAVARGLAAFFWAIGSIPLAALARRVGSVLYGGIGLAVYLFLPVRIVASRAFQPDALMTCSALWATLALARYNEQPTVRRLAIAATGVAIAALIKPMSVFFTVPAAIGLAVTSLGGPAGSAVSGRGHRSPVDWRPPCSITATAPSSGTLARDQMRLRFVPSLLATGFFWNGLATQVGRVFGWPFLRACDSRNACGADCPRSRAARVLWLGYVAFAVAFTYHMPTHDYYHLPYIALVALAATALAERLASRLPSTALHVAAVAFAMWGAYAAWPGLQSDAISWQRTRSYEEIGALAEHATHAVFLDPRGNGYPLMYHGEISGDSWPGTDDLAADALGGAAPVDAATRFARDYDYGATHFIVTDLASLAAQPDLQALLAARATVVHRTPAFHIYKLVNSPRSRARTY